MRVFTEAGGKATKSIMGHLESMESQHLVQVPEPAEHYLISGTIQDQDTLLDFASTFGCYCQFDLFGIENSYYQIKPSIDFFSDAQRIGLIDGLIRSKFEDKILMAHDIHTKHRLVVY